MGPAATTNNIKEMLGDYVKEGGFELAFITDSSGLLMACTETDYPELETQAALLSRIKNTIEMVDIHKGLGLIEEMVFNLSSKRKLICRNFSINKNELILAVSMELNRPYKRLTGSLIRQLESTWDI